VGEVGERCVPDLGNHLQQRRAGIAGVPHGAFVCVLHEGECRVGRHAVVAVVLDARREGDDLPLDTGQLAAGKRSAQVDEAAHQLLQRAQRLGGVRLRGIDRVDLDLVHLQPGAGSIPCTGIALRWPGPGLTSCPHQGQHPRLGATPVRWASCCVTGERLAASANCARAQGINDRPAVELHRERPVAA